MVAILGIDTEPEDVDAVTRAVAASRGAVTARGALDAAVEGMAVVEGAPSFLAAGVGDAGDDEVLTDAAVSGPSCWFAGVAALEQVRNPVRVARTLCGALHPILAGGGALGWARALGLTEEEQTAPVASVSASAAASARAAPIDTAGRDWTAWEWLVGDRAADGGADGGDASVDAAAPRLPGGAAAVLVRDSTGAFGGAMSRASSESGAPGRIGDVVIPGAALFVGDEGAVAISGHDGQLARSGLARAAYAQLAQRSARDAADWAVAQVPDGVHMGIVVLGADGFAVRATTEMAWAAGVADETASSASKSARAAGPASSRGGGR